MPWPPRVGELLPRYDEPVGIKKKLRTYSLDPAHSVGGSKANGFIKMLGIGLGEIDYLAEEIRSGISRVPISTVEQGEAGEVLCLVHFQLAGPGRYSRRTASLRTGWCFDDPGARPRMTTAYLRPRGRR